MYAKKRAVAIRFCVLDYLNTSLEGQQYSWGRILGEMKHRDFTV